MPLLIPLLKKNLPADAEGSFFVSQKIYHKSSSAIISENKQKIDKRK